MPDTIGALSYKTPAEAAAWVNARNADGTFTNVQAIEPLPPEYYDVGLDPDRNENRAHLINDSDFDIIVDGSLITYQSGPRAGQVELWDLSQSNPARPLARAIREAKAIHDAAACKTGGKWSSGKSNTTVSILLKGGDTLLGQSTLNTPLELGNSDSGENKAGWGDAVANPNGMRLIIVGKSVNGQPKASLNGLNINNINGATVYAGVAYLALHNLRIFSSESNGRTALNLAQFANMGTFAMGGCYVEPGPDVPANNFGGYRIKWGMRFHGLGGPYWILGSTFESCEEHCMYIDSPQQSLRIWNVTQTGRPNSNTFLQVVNRAFDDPDLNDPNTIATARAEYLNGTRKIRHPGWGAIEVSDCTCVGTVNNSSAFTFVGFWGDIQMIRCKVLDDPQATRAGLVIWADADPQKGIHLYTPDGGAWPATQGFIVRSFSQILCEYLADSDNNDACNIMGCEKVLLGPCTFVPSIRSDYQFESKGDNLIQSSTASGGSDPFTDGDIFDLNGTVVQNTSYDYLVTNNIFIGNPNGEIDVTGVGSRATTDPRFPEVNFSIPRPLKVRFTEDVPRPIPYTLKFSAVYGRPLTQAQIEKIFSPEGGIPGRPDQDPKYAGSRTISKTQVSSTAEDLVGPLAESGATQAELFEDLKGELLAMHLLLAKKDQANLATVKMIQDLLHLLYRHAARAWRYMDRNSL